MKYILPLLLCLPACSSTPEVKEEVTQEPEQEVVAAWTAQFQLTADGTELASPTLVVAKGQEGEISMEGEDGESLRISLTEDGDGVVTYMFADATTCSLVVPPNQTEKLVRQGHSLEVKYTRTSSEAHQFEKMKTLVGDWYFVDSPSDANAVASYRTTAGGSTLIETLFPGQEHEMTSMIHQDNGRLMLTHYCMLKNQPTMVAMPGDPDKIHFQFLRVSNLASEMDAFMREVTFSFFGPNRLNATWTSWENGKEESVKTFEVERR